jgi:ADP-L-glycero-D-manno-heptose 6-epimerase
MKLLVTGGAGFIGSAIVWTLNQEAMQDIIVVDDKTMFDCKNLDNLKYSSKIDKQDFILDLEGHLKGKNVDGIIHMGACSDTTESNESYLDANNYEYTKKLAKWCLKHDKRYVYASSAATYGDGSQGFSDAHSETKNLKPLNLYGQSKQKFDLWALENDVLDKIAGVKYFNVFGPNEYHKGNMRSVVHKAFGQIQKEGKVNLFKSYNEEYKDGWQLRDFIYVKDAVKMTLFLYKNNNVNGLYNIGTGKARSFYDLVVAIFKAIKLEPNIEYIDMPKVLRGKYQYFTQAKMDKLLHAGYHEGVSTLEEAVTDYVANYLLKDNPYLANALD